MIVHVASFWWTLNFVCCSASCKEVSFWVFPQPSLIATFYLVPKTLHAKTGFSTIDLLLTMLQIVLDNIKEWRTIYRPPRITLPPVAVQMEPIQPWVMHAVSEAGLHLLILPSWLGLQFKSGNQYLGGTNTSRSPALQLGTDKTVLMSLNCQGRVKQLN